MGGSSATTGAYVQVQGSTNSGGAGFFNIVATDGTNSKQLQGRPSGNLFWDSKEVERVQASSFGATGYMRFVSGLQICWGTIILRSACSLTWGVLYDTSNMSGSYAKSFVEIPSVSACGSIGNSAGAYASMLECNVATGSTTSTPRFSLCRPAAVNEVLNCVVRYTAIGRWK